MDGVNRFAPARRVIVVDPPVSPESTSMQELPASRPDLQGSRPPPPRRPATAVAAPEDEPVRSYWEVHIHPHLPPTRLRGRLPEEMVRRYAGSRGSYRFASEPTA